MVRGPARAEPPWAGVPSHVRAAGEPEGSAPHCSLSPFVDGGVRRYAAHRTRTRSDRTSVIDLTRAVKLIGAVVVVAAVVLGAFRWAATSSDGSSGGEAATRLSQEQQRRYDRVLRLATGGPQSRHSLADFWLRKFTSMDMARRFVPPSAFKPYPEGEVPAVACARGRSNPRLWVEGASYCRQDGSIAWDDDWLRGLFSVSADAVPIAVLAHEWGHHIQRLLPDPPSLSIRSELEADCFAGMYLAHAANEGLIKGNTWEPALVFYFLGDRNSETFGRWRGYRRHGLPRVRALAFTTGDLAEGVYPDKNLASCRAFRQYEPPDVHRIRDYSLIFPPGTSCDDSGHERLSCVDARATIRVGAFKAASGGRAIEQFARAWDDWFADQRVLPLNQAYDNPFAGVNGGTAAIRPYTRLGGGQVHHGYLVLLVASVGKAIVMDFTSRHEPVDWEALQRYVSVVMPGVCGPDARLLSCVQTR